MSPAIPRSINGYSFRLDSSPPNMETAGQFVRVPGRLGGLMDIQSQGTKSKTVDGGRWYRIAQATLRPNFPSSLLLNFGNSYGGKNQRHSLVYATFNSYGENIVSTLASTTNRLVSKVRIVKKSTTNYEYNYFDVYIANDSGSNNLYISASNMIGSKLIEPIDVTDQSIPDGYTSVEFDV